MKVEEIPKSLIWVKKKKGRSTYIDSERYPRYTVKLRKQSLRNQGAEQYDPTYTK